MMALLVVLGYTTILAVIIIAVIEIVPGFGTSQL